MPVMFLVIVIQARGITRRLAIPPSASARLGHRVGAPSLEGDQADRLVVVGPGIEVFGSLAPDVCDLRAGQLGFALRDDPAGDVLLQVHCAFPRAVEAAGPEHATGPQRACLPELALPLREARVVQPRAARSRTRP